MKTLQTLIQQLNCISISGPIDQEIDALVYDSRLAKPGALFFAIQGTQTDGHQFIPQVIEAGCKAIVCSESIQAPEHIAVVRVKDTQEAMATVASVFYNHPSSQLKLVAVTGTNGKTTVATLLFQLFRSFGHHVGLISTVQNQIDEEIIPATHTTPDSVKLNQLLALMVERGCEYAFMEASSHAIHQRRVAGLKFTGVCFTNITHDHLDYHLTFDNYLKAKKQLFDEVNPDAFALVNKDDRNGMVMLQNTQASRYTYGLKQMADFKARLIEHDFNGMLLEIDNQEAWFRLVGHFNAYNLLCVYGCAFLLGKSREEIITHLSNLGSVRGRFEYIRSSNGIHGIIDYAHTPDALENILSTINQIRTGNEELITVVGCGGNRDSAKRPIMADVASSQSTRAIFTSDNPRNENPEHILDEMQKGVKPLHYKRTLRISDRKEAIKTAVSLAKPGDVILVAGKGHETYQEIQGVRHPFDDKQVLAELFDLFNPNPKQA
ncbi:MAG: UDP-N-acetylmuramoyl-L-alanyl-D-glutamate--2,6-diaminopimelate ligase [Bacteroidia bacterium]|nr:UDP-N-acetylmuramoyl-L-alanyl-D-glutamate--2,6-diaminopimelate ligase [Bacteroidia bacterium]